MTGPALTTWLDGAPPSQAPLRGDRRAAGSECRSPESCRQTTRDATEILGMMEAMFRGHLPAGQRDPRLPIVP